MDETLLPEENQPLDESGPAEETFPEEAILPDGFTPLGDSDQLPRARRRRAQRMLVPPGADERAALLDSLSRRAFPTIEFFLFALLCGAVLGAAYLFDSSALLLLGILLAPLLTPWVGLALATLTGSWRFFFLTFGGMLVASILVFLTGALAGLAGRLWQTLLLFKDFNRSQVWRFLHLWPLDLFLVALGAILLAISFVRSEQKPVLPSIMLAYGLFLPLSAAGVGLGSGAASLWLDGVLVFLVHLALATLVGMIVLAILRFKPIRASGYLLPLMIGFVSLVVLLVFTGLVAVIRDGITATRRTGLPTPTVLSLPTVTVPALHKTPTLTPTSQASTDTPQPSATAQPTPTYAVIKSPAGGGALVRTEPGAGSVIATLINGSFVQVLPETQNVGTIPWVRVRLSNNTEGWVLQSVLSATTIVPTTAPSLTPTSTP